MNNKRDFETIVREMDARQQIHDCIMRYCRGVDHADMELGLSAYHPDANDNHGTYNGPAEGFLTVSLEVVKELEILRHIICNEYVEFDETNPSVARSETVVLGTVYYKHEDGYQVSLVSCRYLDRFEERDGVWKIADRQLVRDWEADLPAHGPEGTPSTNGMLRGRLNTSDPSFGLGFKRWGDSERPPVSEVRIGDGQA
ncbi:nuclear transport factor 2 family protein [Pseudomonas sp. H11T01]|uniref:nuclear transport factor 2 family protein n=1 Tax=Pseudomonas sp. H11T01 TaxID=3402749 RepID=UPI003AC4BE27